MAQAFVNQHVVPQRYLLRFSERKTHGKGGRIGVRIIDRNGEIRIFTTSISDVAYSRNYYDDPQLTDPKHWEHLFSHEYEPLYGKPLERIYSRIILSTEGSRILNDDDKELIGKLIAIQYLRIPDFLDRQQLAGKKIGANFSKELHLKLGKRLSADKRNAIDRICNSSQSIRSIMMGVVTDAKRVEAYSKLIANDVMTVVYNATSIPFFTSDKPVILFNITSQSMDYGDCGIARADTMIIYPISPQVLIQAYPRAWFNMDGQKCDGERILITEREIGYVISLNDLQINHAHQEVFFPPSFITKVLYPTD